jgi:hypothetical protein
VNKPVLRFIVAWLIAAGAMAILFAQEPPRRPARASLLLDVAVAQAGCTQEDLPAVEIFLAAAPWEGESPSPPYVRIEAAGLTPDAPTSLKLSPLRRDSSVRALARAELHEEREAPVWLTGRLWLNGASRDRAVEGHYRFCDGRKRCFKGAFKAAWRGGGAGCG